MTGLGDGGGPGRGGEWHLVLWMFAQEQTGEVRRVEMWLPGGDGAASLQPCVSPSSRSLPPSLVEGGGGPHTHTGGGGWKTTWYQVDGWKEVDDRVEGCFHVARQQQAFAGKMSKNKEMSCFEAKALVCSGSKHHICRRVTNVCKRELTSGWHVLHLQRQAGSRPPMVARTSALRLAQRQAD